MKNKIVLLVISCLFLAMAGCNSNKDGQATSSPGTIITNPVTLPQQATADQTTTNPAPVPQNQASTLASDTVRQLDQVAGELYSKVTIPVMLPSYWPSIPLSLSMNQNNYCGIQYNAGQDNYSILITTVSKQLPVNSPGINMPPNNSEANRWGFLGGGRDGAFDPDFAVEESAVGEPSVIGGYRGWKTPISFYWENGVWKYEVLDSSESLIKDAQDLTIIFLQPLLGSLPMANTNMFCNIQGRLLMPSRCRVFVPVRYLGQALGVDVGWNGDPNDKTVQLNDNRTFTDKGGLQVTLTIGSRTIASQGSTTLGALITKTMDVAPLIRNGRTYLPARYVAEAFGYTLTWDAAGRTVTIQ